MPTRAIVWFKRDLRLSDHAPLTAALSCDEAAALWVAEPAWLDSPEWDAQHLRFWLDAVEPLLPAVRALGLHPLRREGDMTQVLEALYRQQAFTHLFSHEETGPGWSYERDKAVAVWCRARGVGWQEWPQTGVVRRLRSRQGWAGRWQQHMDAQPVPAPSSGGSLSGHAECRPVGAWSAGEWSPSLLARAASSRPTPPAGEAAAQQVLSSFLQHRGDGYRRALSSPLTAAAGCSRLSPHLSFGAVSMRQVHQATEQRIAELQAEGTSAASRFAYHLRGFSGRLRWHCHFMQKLEDEPDIEWRNFARSADGLREGGPEDRQRLQAWCSGMTGYPMVDACMRQLNATGWLNFRMRAMLVSFAAYHLWLHWRSPGLHLARQFLDVEPGIHWSQMQMQSGTTGINTLRIYSPAKQAAEHDPTGAYVRQWVPEIGTSAYPRPIVDEREALALAKERLYHWRGSAEARAEAGDIQQRHGSRRSGLAPSGARARTPEAGPAATAGGRATRARRGAASAAPSTQQPDLFDLEP